MARRLLQSVPVVMGAPTKYLLRDDFNDTRAAGEINNTAATPGPGTRTEGGDAVNTISGGALNFVEFTTTTNTHRYGAISIGVGTFMVFRFKANQTGNRQFGIGIDPSATPPSIGSTGTGGIQMRYQGWGSAVRFLLNNQFNINTALLAPANANYQLMAFVTGSSRVYIFRKLNTDTNWIYEIVRTGTVGSSLYPYWTNATTTTIDADGAIDLVRIPARKFIPVPLAYDTFTRSNGALGNTEATGPDSQAVVANAWTGQTGTVEVSSNAAIATALTGGLAIATVSTGKSDVLARVALTRGTGTAGLMLRYQNADNYLYAVHNGTNMQFTQRVAGVETPLINTAATYSAGAVIMVILSGTSAEVYYNATRIGTTQTVPSSTFGVHGLYYTDTDSTLDGFEVSARGTGGEYNALDRYTR